MKILVLGGGGFIGSHIAEAFIKAGHAVRIFEKESVAKDSVRHILPYVEWVEGDFINETHVKEAVKGVDIIVHSLCTTLPKSSNENPVYDISSNLISTLHLLDAAKKDGVKKVIFLSSGGTIYGMPTVTPIPETHPTEPLCSYGIQKLSIEKYLKLYNHLHGLDYAILRISNPYGERQRPASSQGAVTVFLYKAIKNETIEIWGDGSVTRDYIYVSDVSGAVMAAAGHGGAEKIFNIGSGEGTSLLDLIRHMENVTGRHISVRFAPARAFDVPVNVLDISRAKRELGWSPQVRLEDGLRRTMDYLSKRQ